MRVTFRYAATLLLAGAMICARAAEPPAAKTDETIASPASSALQVRTSASPEEALFVEKCSMCHRQRGMGTVILARRLDPARAQLERRDDLTPAFISAVVRAGAGNMPRITRGEVSDEQLAVIAGYLTRKRAP
jgi:mono/diheme cytochrome c family protein